MRLRHDRAAVGAGDDGKTALDEIARRDERLARAAAEPQHRAFRVPHQVGERIERARIGLLRGNRPDADLPGAENLLALHVDRDFERDRPARCGERGARRGFHHADCGAALPDAEIGLRDRLEHVGLARHVVDRGAVAVHERPIDLRGDVQDRRAGGHGLDLRARGIAGGRAGRGHHDAERAFHARIGVRHVGGARLAARRHEPDAALARDRVENRHVVDRDHPEHRGDADLGERMRDQVADRLGERNDIGLSGGCGGGHRSSPTCGATRRPKSRAAHR